MLPFLTGVLAASPDPTNPIPPGESPDPGFPERDSVDVTEVPSRHSHVWIVKLPDLDEAALGELRLTVIYGPGCGPPASIWRQVAAGAVAAGAASFGSGMRAAASGIAGTVTASLAASPARHSTFGGRKLEPVGEGWYALTFPCRHEEGAAGPAARLFIRRQRGGGSIGELILATPWRPLSVTERR
jgi:hypothetical protein